MTKTELANLNPNGVFVVDIREPDELMQLPSIPGAVNIPLNNIVEEARNGQLPKDKLIVTICHSGARCNLIYPILEQYGYRTDLLEGGLIAHG